MKTQRQMNQPWIDLKLVRHSRGYPQISNFALPPASGSVCIADILKNGNLSSTAVDGKAAAGTKCATFVETCQIGRLAIDR